MAATGDQDADRDLGGSSSRPDPDVVGTTGGVPTDAGVNIFNLKFYFLKLINIFLELINNSTLFFLNRC